jgi:hypothetical protein
MIKKSGHAYTIIGKCSRTIPLGRWWEDNIKVYFPE